MSNYTTACARRRFGKHLPVRAQAYFLSARLTRPPVPAAGAVSISTRAQAYCLYAGLTRPPVPAAGATTRLAQISVLEIPLTGQIPSKIEKVSRRNVFPGRLYAGVDKKLFRVSFRRASNDSFLYSFPCKTARGGRAEVQKLSPELPTHLSLL